VPTPAVTDDWGARLAARVVEEVGVLAGGRLRSESAALLTDVTMRGYVLFVASLRGDTVGPLQTSTSASKTRWHCIGTWSRCC
jgi:hypothetical protein